MKSILCLTSMIGLVSSFTILKPKISTSSLSSPSPSSRTLLRAGTIDDDISAQLAKARALLEKAKAKVELEESKQEGGQEDEQEEEENGEQVEAVVDEEIEKEKPSVVKSKNEETGLITTDGELMAALSEEEDWEMRDLLELFESERKEESDVSKQLAERDVAASIFNLRMSMHNGDYKAIFDKRNRFIGEDN